MEKHVRGKHIRRRKLPSRRIPVLLRAMMALCVVGMAFFGFLLIRDAGEYSRGDAAYGQVRSVIHNRDTATGMGVETAETASSGMPSKMDFAPLKAVNSDVVGWILSEGSAIDYPVVRGEDNEYYLSHLFNREQNKLGSLFMDCRNAGTFSDKNTVIYGHNMKDGSMFASLTKYKNQNYYDKFPAMALYTPDGDFTIELFAGVVSDGNDEFVRFQFKEDQDFRDYIDALKEKSTFESDTVVKSDDRIVTLCTCSYEFNNARYALFGKLTPIKQS